MADALFSTLLLLLLVVVLMALVGEVRTQNQTAYPTQYTNVECGTYHAENAGYVCSDAANTTCNTLVYYLSQSGMFQSLDAIATGLFGTTAAAIAAASSLNSTTINPGTPLFIPVSCACESVTSQLTSPPTTSNISQAVVDYTILSGDTYNALADETYYGLTTCQAMESSNPTVISTNLQVGQIVKSPIRCACPFQSQTNLNIKLLLTYPVQEGDTIDAVVQMFSVAVADFLYANGLLNTTQKLFPATTVLIPLQVIPTSPPARAPTNTAGTPTTAPSFSSPSSTQLGIYIGIPLAVGLGLILLIAAFITCKRKQKTKKGKLTIPVADTGRSPVAKQEYRPSENSVSSMWNFPSDQKQGLYSLEEITQATQNFDESCHIKGAVYKGVLKDREVAIKKVTRNVSQEIEVLHKVHHLNLITLLGFTMAAPDTFYLIYEYAENGSLSDWLHNGGGGGGNKSTTRQSASFSSSDSILGWIARLQIACDVATALQYIHNHINPSFVHKDIKSSNILLDSKLRGRVANFALAKSSDDMTEGAALTKHIVGTQGYLAPEYIQHGLVTSKLDVFAFGVVLLEILSGKEAIIQGRGPGGGYLTESIGPILDSSDAKENLKVWIDPALQDNYPLDYAYSVAVLAQSCVDGDPDKRPEMRDISYQLAKALDFSTEWQNSGVFEHPRGGRSMQGR